MVWLTNASFIAKFLQQTDKLFFGYYRQYSWITMVADLLLGTPQAINMGLLVRFRRVQVQLKATKEDTPWIIRDLRRSYIFERFFIVVLVLSWILI